jgi:peptide/nickel transport system permease protein
LLSITILSVNLIGDAARDALDPRMKQREGGK